jgi:hypothetical protein
MFDYLLQNDRGGGFQTSSCTASVKLGNMEFHQLLLMRYSHSQYLI